TASGSYPIDAVAMMDRIITRVEADSYYRSQMSQWNPPLQHTGADAITAAARQVAETGKVAAIITYTTSGFTTQRAARERPQVPIVCLTSKVETARRMMLSYGVYAIHTQDASSFSEMVERACKLAKAHGFAQTGDKLVVTAGVPFGVPGNT